MSAYIVDTKTMDRVVAGLMASRSEVLGIRCFGYDEDRDVQTMIGRKLFALNFKAVAGRYSAGAIKSAGWDNNQDYKYRGGYSDVLQVQHFQSFNCLMYQLGEDPVYDSAEYKELDAIRNKMGADLMRTTKECRDCIWG